MYVLPLMLPSIADLHKGEEKKNQLYEKPEETQRHPIPNNHTKITAQNSPLAQDAAGNNYAIPQTIS